MSLAGFQRYARFFDRIAPAVLLTLGLSVSAAFADVIGVI
jgi:hypothetical protein